ncbi:unnamed protein product [Pleuronectes platessa]|uniref:Uncharacterized protein n=1 Tax=Pleuronectes platessa TaxID=8262 RepID=A0A9N7V8N8_PLEPL|nr:unnamed protein product [Pleuronectes platessa]
MQSSYCHALTPGTPDTDPGLSGFPSRWTDGPCADMKPSSAVIFNQCAAAVRDRQVPPLGEQALSSPRRRRLGVRHASRFFLGGRSYSAVPHGVSGAGCFLSLGPWGGVRRRCGRRAVGGDRVRRSAAATLDACRALLADHLSYGARWGNPPFARGGPFRRCASAGA